MKPVTLSIAWEELFGKTIGDLPHDQRVQRWEEWKELAINAGVPLAEIQLYESGELCANCKHLKNGWCKLLDLPSGYDSTRDMVGQACAGLGYKGSIIKNLITNNQHEII